MNCTNIIFLVSVDCFIKTDIYETLFVYFTTIDLQELKGFVDLAMISAGESDMEIDRISFMHTSCLGFGSLIFGLKLQHGYQELMNLCRPVWQAVDSNQNLPEMFVSDYRNTISREYKSVSNN